MISDRKILHDFPCFFNGLFFPTIAPRLLTSFPEVHLISSGDFVVWWNQSLVVSDGFKWIVNTRLFPRTKVLCSRYSLSSRSDFKSGMYWLTFRVEPRNWLIRNSFSIFISVSVRFSLSLLLPCTGDELNVRRIECATNWPATKRTRRIERDELNGDELIGHPWSDG